MKRIYTVVYSEDSPERSEAVSFFQANADTLFPTMDIPEAARALPLDKANEYLQTHPIQEQFSLLAVRGTNVNVRDEDLARLQFLPELSRIQLTSSNITDAGVAHLAILPSLKDLVVYSENVTDACLTTIIKIQSLTSLDFQGSPHVSIAGFRAAAALLPNLVDVYPPFPSDSS